MKIISAKVPFRNLIFVLKVFALLLLSLPMYYVYGDPFFDPDGRLIIVSNHLQFITWSIQKNVYFGLFYLFAVNQIILRPSIKEKSLSLFTLTICYFTIEIARTYLYLLLKNELDKVKWFGGPLLATIGFFIVCGMLYSTIKNFVWFRMQKIENEKKRIESSLSELRSRINPNFLLNSLKSVYSISRQENAPKTSQSIEELAALFLYSLSKRTLDKVPVQNELAFIEKYIHLHRIRLNESDEIKVTVSISWDKKAAEIIPMLLVNFIENSFKYGISATKPSFVEIIVSVENKRLYFVVRNSIHATNEVDTIGFGLQNSEERLKLLYNDRYTLKQKQSEIMHETILNINLG